MSKEEYLKGEKKEKALDIIRYGLATRRTNVEILDLLKSKGIGIAERTLRRFKTELHDSCGLSAFEIFQNNVGNFILDDILTYEEMARQCWKILDFAPDNTEKLKAISTLRLVIAEKLRILKSYPYIEKESSCTKTFPKMKIKYSYNFSPDHYMATNTNVN